METVELEKKLNANIKIMILLQQLEENNKTIIEKLKIIANQAEEIGYYKDMILN